MQLEHWIDPQHLEPAAQAAYAHAFASVPYAAVVIDGFLVREKLIALQALFDREGSFVERFTLWKPAQEKTQLVERTVPAEAWHAAPQSARATAKRLLAGAQPQYRMGQGVLTHLKFGELLESATFLEFLHAVTGLRPRMLTGIQTRTLISGDYVGPHSDFNSRRQLCGIFYLSPDWRPGFGGRFRHLGPGSVIVPVEPRANRLLLFEPRRDCEHDVEPIAEAGANWKRWSYTIWFGEPSAAQPQSP